VVRVSIARIKQKKSARKIIGPINEIGPFSYHDFLNILCQCCQNLAPAVCQFFAAADDLEIFLGFGELN